ncbi:MAG: autotransporter outer membrane beta-barrel domain-containing protein [Acidaminococcaceae bacterium]|nr:autotransporter outer membrane beta-barrel domain-containing protein [Acidaminococcaceae bacterium]
MHSKRRLAKQVLHTLMAMSIVYSSGGSILLSQVSAAELTAKLTDGKGTASVTGSNGADYAGNGSSDPAAAGDSIFLEAVIHEDISSAIKVAAKGGVGGKSDDAGTTINGYGADAEGGAGGDVFVGVDVREGLHEVTVADITVQATGGNAGSSYTLGAVAGAAEAYGIKVKDELKITASSITVESIGGEGSYLNGPDSGDRQPLGSNDGGIADAAAIRGQGGTAVINGNITVKAKGGDDGHGYNAKNGKGGDAAASAVKVLGGNNVIKVQDIVVDGIGGGSSYAVYHIFAEQPVLGGLGEAKIADITDGTLRLEAKDITVNAKGGSMSVSNNIGGMATGAALAMGVDSAGGVGMITAAKVSITAISGGYAGVGCSFDYSNPKDGFKGVDCGSATAIGVNVTAGTSTIEAQSVDIIAEGGTGGTGSSCYKVAGIGGSGGAAEAYGIKAAGGVAVLSADTFTVAAKGGNGGDSGENWVASSNTQNVDAVKASDGSTAIVFGVTNSGAVATITAGTVNISAVGGNGGTGKVANQTSGDGGDGADASAYGAKVIGGITNINADTFNVAATAGTGGTGGDTSKGGTEGNKGSAGKLAEAYGVYAEGGATVNLSGKDTDTISLNITASKGADSNVSYAIHAADSTVNFLSNATITGAASETWLENAALGFSGSSAGRTVTSDGALKLNGSNTFRFSIDLKNNTADKFTFGELAAGSSTEKQYITVGYDKSFSGSDLSSITGTAVVLSFGELNGYDLSSFEGKASTMDSPLKRFTVTPTVEADGNDVKITQLDFGGSPDGNDASETSMTSADTHLALRNIWRVEGNNLMKRMGELRSDPEAAEGGVWARYYRGELSADSAYDRSFSQDYTAFQGGIDKVQDYKGGKLYTGIAVNRIDSNASYLAGSGDLSSTGVGVYASWLGRKGHYLDVIARGSKLANDFKLVDLSGNTAQADYDTWAYGISAEYGYRQDLQGGWFVEPQAELSLGHINSVDYMVSNGVNVRQDSVNSAVTCVGIVGGKEFTVGGRPSNAYLKASLLHDFGGNGGAAGYYGTDSLALQTGDLTGTWYEIGLGANLGLAKNSNLYFDALKTFNGNIRTDWQINAGLRFTF